MNIDSIVNNYNMSSLWNTLSSNNSSLSQINSVEADYLNSSTQQQIALISGESTNSQVQNIFNQIDPFYNITSEYNNLSNSSGSVTGNNVVSSGSDITSLLQSLNTSGNIVSSDIMSQYMGIENGTYQAAVTNILSSNPYTVYSSISSLGVNSAQSAANLINTSV